MCMYLYVASDVCAVHPKVMIEILFQDSCLILHQEKKEALWNWY